MVKKSEEKLNTLTFRDLKADEIDCRVGMMFKDQSGNNTGLSILLYKDARADMNILDETVGAFRWDREHEVINDNLYCTVKVWNEEHTYCVSKQDVGVKSKTEEEKGEASDAFKRACVNLGIGRELYTTPQIYISPDKYLLKNGKLQGKFIVDSIKIENKRIVDLNIKYSKTGKIVYQMNEHKPVEKEEKQKNTEKTTELAEEEFEYIGEDGQTHRVGLNEEYVDKSGNRRKHIYFEDKGMAKSVILISEQQKNVLITMFKECPDKLENILKKRGCNNINDLLKSDAEKLIKQLIEAKQKKEG